MATNNVLTSKAWPKATDPAATRAFRAAQHASVIAGEMRALKGMVRRKLVRRGSQSEVETLVLVAEEGTYRLRRPGGHPLRDPVLDRLENQTVRCIGKLDGNEFFLVDWMITN